MREAVAGEYVPHGRVARTRPRIRPITCAGSSTTTSSRRAAGRTAWRTTASRSGTYWDARAEPNVHLFHYADMWNDLDGEMRRVAAALGVPVDEARWPSVRERGDARLDASARVRRGARCAPRPMAVAEGVLPCRRHARLGVAADAGRHRSTSTRGCSTRRRRLRLGLLQRQRGRPTGGCLSSPSRRTCPRPSSRRHSCRSRRRSVPPAGLLKSIVGLTVPNESSTQ